MIFYNLISVNDNNINRCDSNNDDIVKHISSYESINKFYFLSAAEFMNKFGSGDGKLVVGHAHNINNWKQVWSLISTNTKRSARRNPQFVPAKGSNTQSPLEHSSLSFVRLRT